MSEWKECTINDLGKIITGKTPKTTIESNYGGNIPFLTPSDDLSVKTITSTKRFLTEHGLFEVKNCLIPAGSVCVSCIGSDLGKVVMTSEETVTNQQINSIIPNSDNDEDFIYYLMVLVGKQLNSLSKTSTAVPIINKKTFSEWKISKPGLFNQRRIAAILSSLDAKIENNNKVNAKLEEIAQNLFKEWFVDFGPFKDGKFVDSELGPIPEGWRVGSVYEYVNVIYGAPYKSDKFNENGLGLPLIRIRDLKTSKPQVSTEEILPQTEYVEAGDIVAGMDAEFIPFIWKGEKGLLNQRVCKLKPQVVGIDDLFVMYLMLPHLIFTQSYKVGTTVSHIGKSDFDKFVSVLPPLDIVLHFSEKIAPMRSEIVRLSKETRELAALRDTLLPKLMSGEIEV